MLSLSGIDVYLPSWLTSSNLSMTRAPELTELWREPPPAAFRSLHRCSVVITRTYLQSMLDKHHIDHRGP
jgi:hypothetical protein